MRDSPFLALAERHDLDYAENVERGSGLPKGVSEVVGGRLPGDLDGIVGRHVAQVNGSRAKEPGVVAVKSRSTDTYYQRHSTLVLTRIPESAAFLPYVTCRDTEFSGALDRLIGPGGLIPLVDHVEFESIELNRRYRIGIFRGFGENRLRQLFAPTVIDWMAHEAPDGIYFELMGGMLRATIGGVVETEEQLEHACRLAARLAEIIRSEAEENVGTDGVASFPVSPQQEQARRDRRRKIALAEFDAPPREVAAAMRALEPVVKSESRGFLRRVFSSINEEQLRALAVEAVAEAYAARHGLELEEATVFPARYTALPVPVAGKHSMRGPLPGIGVAGDLLVRTSLDEVAGGAAMPWTRSGDSFLQVVPKGDGPPTTQIGGFSLVAGEGARRESDLTRADREAAEQLERDLGGDHTVAGRRIASGETLTRAMREWLTASERAGKSGLLLGGGTLLALDRGLPFQAWSSSELDRLCESLGPVIAG